MARQAIVIGAGLGGLSAAIHARLNGFDVVVFERQDVVGGKAAGFSEAGYRSDPGPSIVILPRVYEAVFRAAGQDMGAYLAFDRLDPITRVFWRDQMWDVPADPVAAAAIADEIEPGAGRLVEEVLSRFDHVVDDLDATVFRRPVLGPLDLFKPAFMRLGPAMGLRPDYRTWIESRVTSPALRAFFLGFPSYSGLSYHTKSASPLMIPYFMLREGVYHPRGGVAAIPAALERLAQHLGVEFRHKNVERVRVEGSRIAAVEDERADVVISNVDPLTFGTLLGRTAKAKPTASYFTVQWGLRRRVPDLAHHTLFLPDDPHPGFVDLYEHDRFPASPIVYVNAVHATDPTCAPLGCSNVFAVVSSPARVDGLDWSTLEREAYDRTRTTLRAYGLDPTPDEIDIERVQTPLTFERRDGSYRGALYGLVESERGLGGMFPAPNKDRQFQNLFYCGGAVQPGAGMPMVTLSGRFAADLATEYASRRLRP